MWIFTTKGFISVVADQNNPNNLLVRSRLPGELEAVVPGTRVKKTPDHDYLYRASVPREQLADILALQIENIDYDNFKNAAGPRRHNLLFRIWNIMWEAQEQRAQFRRRRRRKFNLEVPGWIE
jgi:hypothetical protein